MKPPPLSGRGTNVNPPNRFDRIHLEPDPEADEEESAAEPTVLYRDASKSVLVENDSPDVGFRFGLNPYRGCEHGCVYCYARPSHEYLSFNAGLDFERRLVVKENAPALLREHFRSPRWQPQVVALSGNTDCYQPIERRLRITRRCLEVFAEFRTPVGIGTKSALVTRDVDVLRELADHDAVHVVISVTTLDRELARRMEPRAATPERRLDAIAALSAAGISVGVMAAPIVPGLNDSEIPAIVERAARAGARSASWVMLRLPTPVDALFVDWLERNYPDRKQRVLNRIRECRNGQLTDARFGRRMCGEGAYADQINALFRACERRAGLHHELPGLNVRAFRRPPQRGDQLTLFG